MKQEKQKNQGVFLEMYKKTWFKCMKLLLKSDLVPVVFYFC